MTQQCAANNCCQDNRADGRPNAKISAGFDENDDFEIGTPIIAITESGPMVALRPAKAYLLLSCVANRRAVQQVSGSGGKTPETLVALSKPKCPNV